MGSIANIIECRGLVTFSSELKQAPGSLRQALNVNIDEDGVITPRRGFNDYGNFTTGVSSVADIVEQIMEYKNSIIRQFNNKLEYEDTNNTFQSVTGTYTPIREGFRTKWQEANSNLYFTSDDGIKKISETSRANLNSNMVTNAGGLKAGYSEGKIVPTVGGFLPPQSKIAYRVLYGTRDNNNNLIYGAPSSRFVITNFAEDAVTYEQSEVTIDTATHGAIVNGDHFILNNGSTKYTIYYDIDGNATEPQIGGTIGSTYVKISTGGSTVDSTLAAITANVIANNVAGISVTLDTTTVTITYEEEGDITDIDGGFAADGTGISRIATSTSIQGNTVTGSSATVQINGIVPSGATTEYFYQIYRTAPITVTTGLTINDIDPGDEMNLVYESGLTTAEITAGEFTVTDTTPDSFRASALPLYTNEATGSGILQANEVPPIALDIELFKNYMFYANTKQKHKQEFTVVSVDNFVSGSTKIIIGNDQTTRYYTFVGAAQVQDITINAVPTAGDYINLYSASDKRQYYIYFGDTVDDPEVAGAIGYRVSLDGTSATTDIATRIEAALVDNVDFDLSVASSTITFTWTNNGETTGIEQYDAYVGTTSYQVGDQVSDSGFNYYCIQATTGVDDGSEDPSGTATDNSYWRYVPITISPASTTGDGEATGTDEGGDILLSGLTSVGQAIDETARSIVKVISSDPDSPVNAYYLSTGEELPGNILLEARSLEDRTFYIAIDEPSDTAIGDEFTPELPYSREIAQFEESSTDADFTTITLNSHGYSDGDQVFVGYFKDPGSPGDPDSFSGVYTIANSTTNTFDIEVNNVGVVAFVPTNSTVFTPDVESDNEEIGNRVYYSKRMQPEAVPSINFFDVGPQDSEIKRILALRDELYVLKDDGIYVVSGTSAPDWNIRLVDSARILAPDSAVVLNNQIYCLTDQGVTRVSAASAAVISRGIEDRIKDIVDEDFDFEENTFGIAYENDRAYILFMPQTSSDTTSTQAYRYNIFERTWSRWEYNATCGHVLSRNEKLYLGNGDRNVISQERKNHDRTDYSDRNFSAAINTNGVSGNVVELSTLVNVATNDVIVQKQDVSIYYINYKLLKKMDLFDTGITPPTGSTMFASFGASTGDNLASVMQSINDYLRTLDAANITAKTFTTSNIRTNTELLVTELNDAATITAVKTYKNPQTVYYEAYITERDSLRNQVTIHTERPFVEDSIEVYKGYTATVEWNPMHFGNPTALKQINYAMLMFDQNNFNSGIAKFYSDAAQSAVEVNFNGKGIAYWGDLDWGAKTAYWGGEGNDMPFRTPVPRGKQKCRYLSILFEHKNAREYFRLLGVGANVRQISDKAYRSLR